VAAARVGRGEPVVGGEVEEGAAPEQLGVDAVVVPADEGLGRARPREGDWGGDQADAEDDEHEARGGAGAVAECARTAGGRAKGSGWSG
jgi:hypothetical protein